MMKERVLSLSVTLVLIPSVVLVVCTPPISKTNRLERAQVSESRATTLAQQCKSIHRIKHISVMLNLIENLKDYRFERGDSNIEDRNQSPWAVPQFMRNHLNVMDPKRACIRQADAIMDLEPILAETKRVCSKAHLDKIEAYRRNHVRSLTTSARFKLTQSFFVLYAGQVSVVCKQHLRRSIEAAEKLLNGTEDLEQITLFLKPPNNCHDLFSSEAKTNNSEQTAIDRLENIEKQIDQTNDQQSEPRQMTTGSQAEPEDRSEKVKLRCSAIDALSEIKSINQLVAMLGMDIQWDSSDEAPEPDGQSEQEDVDRLGDTLERVMPASARQNLNRLYEICPKFERIYSQNIMSIVRLTRMGFDPEFPIFDKTCRENKVIQKWFGITMICNSLLRDGSKKFGFLDWPASDTMGDKRDLDDIIASPIADKLTVGKYLPGRFSKLSSDFSRKIKQILRIQDDSNIMRSLKTIGRYIAIALAMTVSLLTTGSTWS